MKKIVIFLLCLLAISILYVVFEETPKEIYEKGVSAYQEGDYSSAIDFFEKAAAEGYGPAGTALGKMYAQGKGVEPDDYKAFQYYYKVGAGFCDPEGEFLTGLCYYDGVGTSKNELMGITFIIRAASQGYTDAIKFCVMRDIKYE